MNEQDLLLQQVVYWEDDTKPDTMGKVRISGNFTQVNVSGLRPSSAYYLSVAAFNTAGPGPQSLPINATTKEPRESACSPSAPRCRCDVIGRLRSRARCCRRSKCDARELLSGRDRMTKRLSGEDQREDVRWVGRAGTLGSTARP